MSLSSTFETKLYLQLHDWAFQFDFYFTEVEETLHTLTTLDHPTKPIPFDYAVSIVPNILDDARRKKQSPIEIAITFRHRYE